MDIVKQLLEKKYLHLNGIKDISEDNKKAVEEYISYNMIQSVGGYGVDSNYILHKLEKTYLIIEEYKNIIEENEDRDIEKDVDNVIDINIMLDMISTQVDEINKILIRR